jgi:hypothetical protein
MKILAIARVDPQATLERIQPFLEAEVKLAWQCYKDGSIREMYRCQDRRLGVVFIMECLDVEAARRVLAELPFVREKFIEFEIIPLGPFQFLEMLFLDLQALPLCRQP